MGYVSVTEAKMLGYFMGDGCASGNQPTPVSGVYAKLCGNFTGDLEYVAPLIRELGWTTQENSGSHPSAWDRTIPQEWVRRWKLLFRDITLPAHEKEFPLNWRNWPENLQAALLSGYWQADGSVKVYYENGKRGRVRAKTVSPILAEEVRQLLELLGIRTSKRGPLKDGSGYGRGNNKDKYEVIVLTQSYPRFVELMKQHPLGPDKQVNLDSLLELGHWRPRDSVAYTQGAENLQPKIEELRKQGKKDTDIAVELGIGPSTVWLYAGPRKGEEYQEKKQEIIDKAKELFAAGLSHHKIALQLGVPRPTVSQWLRGGRRTAPLVSTGSILDVLGV